MGRHVNGAQRACECDGLGLNEIVRVGENSGSVISRLWTKIHKISGQCRRPVVLSNTFTQLSMSRFVQKVFAIKFEVVEKPNKCKRFLAPLFSWGTTSTVLQQTVSAIYHPPFGNVWLSSVC